MREKSGWVIPLVCFLTFVVVMVAVVFLAESDLISQTQKPSENVMSMQDFQKALDSSLK